MGETQIQKYLTNLLEKDYIDLFSNQLLVRFFALDTQLDFKELTDQSMPSDNEINSIINDILDKLTLPNEQKEKIRNSSVKEKWNFVQVQGQKRFKTNAVLFSPKYFYEVLKYDFKESGIRSLAICFKNRSHE